MAVLQGSGLWKGHRTTAYFGAHGLWWSSATLISWPEAEHPISSFIFLYSFCPFNNY